SVDRDISDTYFNKMCQRIKAMNYSGVERKSKYYPINLSHYAKNTAKLKNDFRSVFVYFLLTSITTKVYFSLLNAAQNCLYLFTGWVQPSLLRY
ncbi:hypothetical protein, partial [Enterococcus faecium]|uniref:hypothetical protein n=1 Tax=Enterococcus faecium TaxID=1352 RepID=UPI0025437AEE